jgi:hypothetical protein
MRGSTMNERLHVSGRMAEFERAVAARDREALLRIYAELAPETVAHADAVDEILKRKMRASIADCPPGSPVRSVSK